MNPEDLEQYKKKEEEFIMNHKKKAKYLKENSNLDVNIALHEANVHRESSVKVFKIFIWFKKIKYTILIYDLKKFHFHQFNGSNRIVINNK